MGTSLTWILMVSISPIAFLVLILMASLKLLRFLYKALLLSIIVAINTPFAVMCNVSILVIGYKLPHLWNSSTTRRDWFDPRASVGIEVQALLSDFFKVVVGELLLVLSTGIITFYTTLRPVFYISISVGVAAILLKWLNTNSLSKTAFSYLCDGSGLNAMMFLFSFVGLFDIGCHPIAKCSFVAQKAFLFVKDHGCNYCNRGNTGYRFDRTTIDSNETSIEFSKWNAFERGLFKLIPKINFIRRNNGKYILKSFMVLKLLGVNLCKYPVERLELSEGYAKPYELFNFLVTLSRNDGFVTDKMIGRYEQCLTLLEIVDGVQESVGYRTADPIDPMFLVAGYSNYKHKAIS